VVTGTGSVYTYIRAANEM